jgi:hypothetical protein
MHQSRVQRSIRSPMGVRRVGVLAATIAVAFLANTATWTAALAQQVGPIAQHEAPRQKCDAENDTLDKKVQNDICSACALDKSLDSSICHAQHEAPITYRQKFDAEHDALDKKVQNDICSACALDKSLDSSICHGC